MFKTNGGSEIRMIQCCDAWKSEGVYEVKGRLSSKDVVSAVTKGEESEITRIQFVEKMLTLGIYGVKYHLSNKSRWISNKSDQIKK